MLTEYAFLLIYHNSSYSIHWELKCFLFVQNVDFFRLISTVRDFCISLPCFVNDAIASICI